MSYSAFYYTYYLYDSVFTYNILKIYVVYKWCTMIIITSITLPCPLNLLIFYIFSSLLMRENGCLSLFLWII